MPRQPALIHSLSEHITVKKESFEDVCVSTCLCGKTGLAKTLRKKYLQPKTFIIGVALWLVSGYFFTSTYCIRKNGMSKWHIIKIPSIFNNSNGYLFLSILCSHLNELKKEHPNILITMYGCTWFSANLLSVLGALLDDYAVSNKGVRISVEGITEKLNTLWSRNSFNTVFGVPCTPSTVTDTTIDFKWFGRNERKQFNQHFKNNVLSRPQIPSLSTGLFDRIVNDISEIYCNFEEHTSAGKIFVCGQYFTKENELSFSIVDIGTSIPYNVRTYLRNDTILKSTSCIEWALEAGNTTKPEKKYARGMGLSIIKDLLEQNRGKLIIMSGDELYENKFGKNVAVKKTNTIFTGTLITLTFNLSDRQSYHLVDEIPDSFF